MIRNGVLGIAETDPRYAVKSGFALGPALGYAWKRKVIDFIGRTRIRSVSRRIVLHTYHDGFPAFFPFFIASPDFVHRVFGPMSSRPRVERVTERGRLPQSSAGQVREKKTSEKVSRFKLVSRGRIEISRLLRCRRQELRHHFTCIELVRLD